MPSMSNENAITLFCLRARFIETDGGCEPEGLVLATNVEKTFAHR